MIDPEINPSRLPAKAELAPQSFETPFRLILRAAPGGITKDKAKRLFRTRSGEPIDPRHALEIRVGVALGRA